MIAVPMDLVACADCGAVLHAQMLSTRELDSKRYCPVCRWWAEMYKVEAQK